jgi:hypothetical protein
VVAGSPYAIVPSAGIGNGLGNYTIGYVNGSLTVSSAALTVTADNQTKAYGAANPVLTVRYSGFVNGDTAASLITQPTVSTPATTASAPGTYAITASGATSANYTFTYVGGTLTVTPNFLVSDTFTGANGTLLPSHAPDVNQTGHAWTMTGATPTPTLVGGRATVTAGSGHLQATIDSGVSDIQMATDYVVGAGPGLGALAFRLSDAANFLLLETNGNNLQFYRQQAGAWVLVASKPLAAVAAGSTHRLEVRAVGSSVQGWWDGVQVMQVTETFQQTATRHGLDWNSAYDTTTAFDNFTLKLP